MIQFIIGFILGAIVSLFLYACIIAGKNADEQIYRDRRNKPLLLDKMMYKEHPLAKKLKDSPISEYNPKWVKNLPEKQQAKEKNIEKPKKKKKMGWDTF